MPSPFWSEIIAVFGGTFDPPHLGHREAVEGLFEAPGVKSVRILPAGNPNLKTAQTDAHHRLEMVRLNFSDLKDALSSRIEIDDREIKRSSSLEKTFTIDTLLELRSELGDRLAFVIGTDQLESLERWHRVRELLELCHWIVIQRIEGSTASSLERVERAFQRLVRLGLIRPSPSSLSWSTPGGRSLVSVQTPARETSSTRIRQKIATQIVGQSGTESLPQPVTENLHPKVESYLKAHHLYGT